MFELIQHIPEPWRQLAEVLIAPLAWIPRLQHTLWDFFFAPGPLWLVAGKFIFLLFPALLAVAAVWCTQLSLYTFPFRSGRAQFIPTMMLTWWDAVRAVWLYGVGMFRLVGVALGWAVAFGTFVVKLVLEVIRQIALMPFTMTGRMTQNYFTPGVPWIAFVMLIFWCALEAAIFSYTLMPTVTELLTDLVGGESTARYTGPILYFFLLLLVMGSFACVQTLVAAAGGGAQAGDRMAPRQKRRARRLPGATGLADRGGRAQLRDGSRGLAPGLLATLQGPQRGHADLAHSANLAHAGAAEEAGDAMSRLRISLAIRLVAAALISAAVVVSAAAEDNKPPRSTLFVGVDTSGSFRAAYDDALTVVAHYLYGHMHELGGLSKPRDLFVTAIGGKDNREPKSFHPIHEFNNKDVRQIETDLRKWFPPTDTLTDFNVFFEQIARTVKDRNLVLAPITVMVVSDGVPDVRGGTIKSGTPASYQQIDLSPLDYLSKNVTVRLVYASPKVGDNWRKLVKRDRVRFWAVEYDVMKGWRAQMKPDADLPNQDRLWKWVRDNVDYRVRRGA